MITIINYGSGNIKAIGNIYDRLRIPYIVANSPEEVKGSQKIILPGVGAFDETIKMLDETGFRSVLDYEVLTNEVPVLGICVGMQILANKSEEGVLKGLGWIDGEVKKIDKSILIDKPKLPHLGWNSISIKRKGDFFDNIIFNAMTKMMWHQLHFMEITLRQQLIEKISMVYNFILKKVIIMEFNYYKILQNYNA